MKLTEELIRNANWARKPTSWDDVAVNHVTRVLPHEVAGISLFTSTALGIKFNVLANFLTTPGSRFFLVTEGKHTFLVDTSGNDYARYVTRLAYIAEPGK